MILDVIRWYFMIGFALAALSLLSLKGAKNPMTKFSIGQIVRATVQTVIIWPIFVLYVCGVIEFGKPKK